jgi:hypothetical protein
MIFANNYAFIIGPLANTDPTSDLYNQKALADET